MNTVDVQTLPLFESPSHIMPENLPTHEKVRRLVQMLYEGMSIEDAAKSLGQKKKWAYYWVEESRKGRGNAALVEAYDSQCVAYCDLCNGPIERQDRTRFRLTEPNNALWSRPSLWDEEGETVVSLPPEARTLKFCTQECMDEWVEADEVVPETQTQIIKPQWVLERIQLLQESLIDPSIPNILENYPEDCDLVAAKKRVHYFLREFRSKGFLHTGKVEGERRTKWYRMTYQGQRYLSTLQHGDQ